MLTVGGVFLATALAGAGVAGFVGRAFAEGDGGDFFATFVTGDFGVGFFAISLPSPYANNVRRVSDLLIGYPLGPRTLERAKPQRPESLLQTRVRDWYRAEPRLTLNQSGLVQG